MFVSPQKSYVDILTCKVMVLGVGTFGRWLGQEGGDLTNRISALKKEAPESNLPPFDHTEASGILW